MVIQKLNPKRFLAIKMPVKLGILKESEIGHHSKQNICDM